MQTKSMWKTVLGKGISGILGILCSMVGVMGCFPLVPGYFAAVMLEQRRNLFLYIGVAFGMIRFMELKSVVKYLFILILCTAGIRFYQWANRKCGGWAAGVITGIATFAMNISGTLFTIPDKQELLVAASESLMVLGLTVVIHYLLVLIPGMIRPVTESGDHKAEAVLAGTDERIEAFVSAFGGLSATFASLSQPRKTDPITEVGKLQKEITGKMCASCEGCPICWSENRTSPAMNIHQMLTAVVQHKPKEEIVKQEYMSQCPRYSSMVEEAIQAFTRLELNQAWYSRLLENRIMIAQQLDAMADMMGEWVNGTKCLDRKYCVQLAKIQYEVKERGMLAEHVHIFKDESGHLFIQAEVASKWGGGIPVRNYVLAVSKAMEQKFRIGKEARSVITRDASEVVLYEETRFYTLPGIATRKKDGSTMSGDNFSTLGMDNGQYMVALSDGMGSGTEANQESEMVVELLEKFIEAGFKKETAVKMMNSAMVLQGENDSFSTLDYASIDLYSGKLDLIKIGAAATFIKRDNEVEIISSGSLPAGAVCDLQSEHQSRTLEHGDFLVMVTDGVVEYLHVKNPEEKLSEIIEEVATDNAGVLAKSILERVLLFTGGYALDDMTILVTGIWEK